jgi:hypothetical protein
MVSIPQDAVFYKLDDVLKQDRMTVSLCAEEHNCAAVMVSFVDDIGTHGETRAGAFGLLGTPDDIQRTLRRIVERAFELCEEEAEKAEREREAAEQIR